MMRALILYLRQMTNKKEWILFPLFLVLVSCEKVSDKIEPQITYTIHENQISRLQPAFPSLTIHEKKEEWGKEYLIGMAFAKELDLYRAITALKRANILIPEDFIYRRAEIQYYILLCYYLGGKYEEAIDTFDKSELSHVSDHFPTYKDLLVMLYECFLKTEQTEKAQFILQLLKEKDPAVSEKLSFHTAISHANFQDILANADTSPIAQDFKAVSSQFKKEKKSTFAAQFLNATIPGAGFLYVGQKQSALTSFLLNGLFIGAATHFFMHGNIAAGLITTSFETGWYFGGIYGAGEAAKLYNERIYETKAHQFMQQKKLFPIFMIEHAF
ncbi:MAG: tetratricopeptide repeat protein [Chlamydiales bacterium]|nr:tetratricopeptide repeat protein [Chlamydiales bacterium]